MIVMAKWYLGMLSKFTDIYLTTEEKTSGKNLNQKTDLTGIRTKICWMRGKDIRQPQHGLYFLVHIGRSDTNFAMLQQDHITDVVLLATC